MQGVGYDVGSKFVRGGTSVAAVTVVCFGLTADGMEAERAERIAFILNVAATMHLNSVAFTSSEASIDEILEHELETNRGNYEEERRRERLRYRRMRASFFASFHIYQTLGPIKLIDVFN